MMTTSQRALGDLLSAAPRAWQRTELVKRFSRHALDQQLREGAVARVLPAIYVGRQWYDSFEARLSAIGIWAPKRLAVTGLAGARLWLLSDQTPHRIDVIGRQPLHVTGPAWLRIHTTTIDGMHFRINGVRVQDAEDVVLRTWNTLDPQAAVSFVIGAIRSGRVTARVVMQRQSAYPLLKRRRALIALLRHLDGGIDSYLEYLAATTVFNTREFAGFNRQVRVVAGGRRYVLDMLDEAAQVAIELDGRAYHSSDSARRGDLERDANLASVGILTLRFTYEDIKNRPEWCRDKTRRTLWARRSAP